MRDRRERSLRCSEDLTFVLDVEVQLGGVSGVALEWIGVFGREGVGTLS